MNFRDARWWTLAAIAAVSLLWGAPTEGSEITFDQTANAGIVSYDGTVGGTMVGTDILFESIVGTNTENDDTIDCDGCFLDFETGGLTGISGDEYTFAAGGTFILTGGSVAAGIPAGTTLLTGTFTEPVVVTVRDGFPDVLATIALGEDTKDELLLAYFFPLDPPPNWAFINSTIQITFDNGVVIGPGTGFTADLSIGGDADLVNTSVVVPEPGSSLLLLLGLGSLAAGYRRRSS
jgi:hypothetical protein